MLEWRPELDDRPPLTGSDPARVVVVDIARVGPVTVASSWYVRGGKRLIDLVGAALLLIPLAPLLVILWLSLTLTLGGHALLVQHRVGRQGETYRCLKFRTMRPDRRQRAHPFVGDDRRLHHKSDADPRHTSLGRLLRRYSLDEIPQLWNVVVGHMSLVGPRPEMETNASADFRSHVRHEVRPGLTGPFQLSPLRRSGDLRSGLWLDADYVGRVSLRTDTVLLVRTLGAVVRGTGS